MFTLTTRMPWHVELNHQLYAIDLSFDNVLAIIDLLNDAELSDIEQITTALYLFFGQYLQESLEDQSHILTQLFEVFIEAQDDNNDVQYDIAGNVMPTHYTEDKESIDYYDLTQDAPYIYASFLQDYHMDLFQQQGKLHWWQFKALLMSLSEETKFKKVLEIRQMELPTGKGSSKQREAIRKMKEIYAIKR